MDERNVENISSIEGFVNMHSKDDCRSAISFSIRLAIL